MYILKDAEIEYRQNQSDNEIWYSAIAVYQGYVQKLWWHVIAESVNDANEPSDVINWDEPDEAEEYKGNAFGEYKTYSVPVITDNNDVILLDVARTNDGYLIDVAGENIINDVYPYLSEMITALEDSDGNIDEAINTLRETGKINQKIDPKDTISTDAANALIALVNDSALLKCFDRNWQK